MRTSVLKDLWFIGGSRDDIRSRMLPEEVRDDFGHTLWMVQTGEMPDNVSPFEGSRSNEVLKITERHEGDTYRCVFAAKFERAVYVLHVFKKKSTTGISTPRKDIQTVQRRLAEAKADYSNARKAHRIHPWDISAGTFRSSHIRALRFRTGCGIMKLGNSESLINISCGYSNTS